MSDLKHWEITIGLEVHIQLLTKSKLFSGSANTYGSEPNMNVSGLDLALPGTLPVLNEEAVRMAVLFGLSIGASIPSETVFSRKHYFYPDLPKGYQISQHNHPIVGRGGSLTIERGGEPKKVNITRAHLEEDAGKSIHDESIAETSLKETGIDFNRAGVPLLEIVTEPDLASAEEAVTFLKQLHQLVRYLGICDGNMQEGSFRCDANVSVRPSKGDALGTRCELKNLNSFKFLEEAIQVEAKRQIAILNEGGSILSETRSYDPTRKQTIGLRPKEVEADYRFIPDPDLCPLPLTKAYLDSIRVALPELPQAKCERFQTQYELSAYDANILTENYDYANYFEQVVATGVGPKLAAGWMNGELSALLNQSKYTIQTIKIAPQLLGDLLKRIEDETISRASAKVIFETIWETPRAIDELIQTKGLGQINEEHLIVELVCQILEDSPKQVASYREGKTKLFGFFVGQAMQRSKGRCHPGKLNDILNQQLAVE